MMVEIDKLSKRFGPIQAVREVSFKVDRGEVLGFLGPNGAGKSTTMKMITCFLTPTSGTARVCGFDIHERPMDVRRRIGYLPEGAPAYPDMTTLAFLRFIAEIRGYSGGEKQRRVDRAVELVGLQGVLHQSIDTLSKGFKRRVGLAQAILHDPEVLILDEPTDGLDPNQKHDVRSLIKSMAKDKVIILSTHILEEVDAVCSRAIIIAKGTVIFDGTPDRLAAKSKYHNAVLITLDRGVGDEAAEVFKGMDFVSQVEDLGEAPSGGRRLLLYPEGAKVIVGDVWQIVRANNWKVDELNSEAGRLDEVFRTLTMAGTGERT